MSDQFGFVPNTKPDPDFGPWPNRSSRQGDALSSQAWSDFEMAVPIILDGVDRSEAGHVPLSVCGDPYDHVVSSHFVIATRSDTTSRLERREKGGMALGCRSVGGKRK